MKQEKFHIKIGYFDLFYRQISYAINSYSYFNLFDFDFFTTSTSCIKVISFYIAFLWENNPSEYILLQIKGASTKFLIDRKNYFITSFQLYRANTIYKVKTKNRKDNQKIYSDKKTIHLQEDFLILKNKLFLVKILDNCKNKLPNFIRKFTDIKYNFWKYLEQYIFIESFKISLFRLFLVLRKVFYLEKISVN